MDVMHQSAAAVKYFMHEGIPPDASFLTTEVVLEAEAAFVRAGGGGGSDGRRQAGAGEEGAVRKTPFLINLDLKTIIGKVEKNAFRAGCRLTS
jgi:hypothetical protein